MGLIREVDAEYLPENQKEIISKGDFITDLKFSGTLWGTIKIHLKEKGISEEDFFKETNLSGKEQIMLKDNFKTNFSNCKSIAKFFNLSDAFELFKTWGSVSK
jgi:guanylate kinase